MRNSALIKIGLAAALLLGAGFISGCDLLRPPEAGVVLSEVTPTPASSPATVTPLKTVPARKGDLSGFLKVRGRVASSSEYALSFRRAGYLKTLGVKIGDLVDKGALVAELDDPDLDDRIRSAQMDLDRANSALTRAQLSLPPGRSSAAAKAITAAQQALDTENLKLAKLKAPPTEEDLAPLRAELETAQVAFQRAKNEYDFRTERYLEAYQQELNLRVAAANLDAAKAALTKRLNGARPEEIAIAESGVRSAETNLLRAKADYDYEVQIEQTTRQRREADITTALTELRVRADQLALLQARLGDIRLIAPFAGSIVSLDAQVGDKISPYQSLGILANPDQPEVEAQVPEEALPLVSVNQKGDVIMDGRPNERYQGTVRQIPAKPTLWQGKQVYLVRLGFTDSKIPATIRQGSDIYLTITKSNVLLAPLAAIGREDDKRFVMLASSAGKPVRAFVTVGLANETDAEIVSGLKEGDQIVAGIAN